MNRILLIIVVWLACVLPSFSANPSYEAFIGTNGIIVTSNPPQGRVIIDGSALTNGAISAGALLWTNEPAGRIHPIEFTNRVELHRVLVIGTNYASFAGPVNSNDFLFAYRDITKGERWGPRFEIGVFSNSVASRIFYSLNQNSTVMDIVTTDEGNNSSSISMAATANNTGPSLTLTRTNGTLPFAVSGTNTTLHNVQYTFPQAQGASGTVLTNNGAGVLGWGTVVGGAGSGLTNIFTPSPSNAIMKPLVVGVGDAEGATNTTGHIRGLEAGSGIDLVENGTNVVISLQGSVVSFTDLVWTNDNGTLKPLAFPTNILLTVNVPDNGTGTNFYFDSRVYRTNAATKLFAIYNGGSNAVTVGPNGGLFMGRNNETPGPGVVLSGIYDTALGETNQQEIFVMSQNSAVGYLGAVDLLVDTNYGAIVMTAQNAGGTRFSRWSIQAGAGLNPEAFATFTMQALVDGATYFQVDPNFSTLTRTAYLFSSSVRITNTHILMSLQNSNTPVFEVDGVGDLRMIKRVPYVWPSANAVGVLNNDGAGLLSWAPAGGGSGLTTNANQFLGVPLSIIDGANLTNINVWGGSGVLGIVVRGTNDAGASENVMIQNQGVSPNSSSTIRFSTGAGTSLAKVRAILDDTNGGTSGRLTFQTRMAGSIVDRVSINTNGFVGINLPVSAADVPLQIAGIIGGQDPSIRMVQTNNRGYTEFTITNSVISTNRFVFSFGSNTVAAGDLFTVHSTTISDGINNILVTNGAAGAAAASTIRWTNQLWVELTGNDATGVRNDPSKPFRTMTNAMAATIPGDVINVGVGRFTNLAGPLTISNTVTIRGIDQNNTVLLGTNALGTTGVNFKPRDNSTIENLRLEISENLGIPSPLFGVSDSFDTLGFTNVMVRNVRFQGFTDNVVISMTANPCQATFINCEFDTGGDMVVLHGNAASHLKFKYCHFFGHTNNVAGVNSSALRASTGDFTYEFCNFSSTNNGPVVKGLELISTAGARLESCTFNLGCIGGNVSNVMSTSSRPVVLVNCLVTTNTMSGYVIQEPAFVQGVAAGNNVTVSTSVTAVVTISAASNFTVINASNIVVNDTSIRTNMYTTNISATPLVGTIWHNGTNFGHPETNGARVGFEYVPTRKSLRQGQLSTGTGNNYWDGTNLGIGSVAFGSNNLAGGYMSSVLGGSQNLITTNTILSVIVGGDGNSIAASGGGRNFIGGGNGNVIEAVSSNSVIVGGRLNTVQGSIHHATISGGELNRIRQLYGTIAGGVGNDAQGTYAFIGGGKNNVCGTASGDTDSTIGGGSGNQIDSQFGSIIGGNDNRINTSGDTATIGGGGGNDADGPFSFIGGGFGNRNENLNSYGVIAGGYTNYISSASDTSYSFISGGVSNRITAAPMAAIIGNYGTNATPKSILLSPAGTHGSNRIHITATATTNIGPLRVTAGNAFVAGTYPSVGGSLVVSNNSIISAGAVETNLITYSVPAHVLTNTGDRLVIRASGRFAANVNPKQLKLILGSETILDTTSQVANSGAWVIDAEIIRTGNTAQSVNASYHGTAESLFTLASSLDLAQTNGIATVLKITSTAAGDGDVTNRTLTVTWMPSP